MKLLNIFMVALLAVFIGACGGAATETAKDDKDKPKTEDTKTTDDTNKPEDTKNKTTADADSPKAAFEALARAWKAKDAEAFKKHVSSATMKQMEEAFEESKDKLKIKSIDELLEKQMEAGAPFKDVPEIRNEKIDGDKATIEVDTEGEWETFDLVKEDGSWKVDLSKMG